MIPINAKYIKGPFRRDANGGYVFGTPNDFMFAQVRGWGHLQHEPNAEAVQDANHQFMVDALNEKVARDGLNAPDDPLRTKDLLLINQTRNERIGELEAALQKISDIRDSIVGYQGFNFSEHAYPLVAVLDGAGFKGKGYEISSKNLGTLIEQIKAAEAEVERLTLIITNHQKQRGDDRCYLDDLEMYAQVGLTEGNTALPPKEEFLKNCARYHDSRQAPGHKYMTVAEQLKPLEDQIQELKQKLADRVDRHDADGKALMEAQREIRRLKGIK